jgi:hypothetical protein
MSEFINHLSKCSKSATFVTVHGYTNKEGEVSDIQFIFNFSYHSAVQKSIDQLASFIPQNELQLQALTEIKESLTKSLNPAPSNYDPVANSKGEIIKGIGRKEDKLYINGLVQAKRVIKAVEYKKVNSKPLTIEKNKIRENLKVSKYRTFKLENFESITINGVNFTYDEIYN